MWLESNVARLMFGAGVLIIFGLIMVYVVPRWGEFSQTIHSLITRRSMFVK